MNEVLLLARIMGAIMLGVWLGACTPAARTIVPTLPAPTSAATIPLTAQPAPNLPEFVWRAVGTGGFYKPGGLAADGQGNLYLWDGGNLRILVLDREGKAVTSWGGPGTADGQFGTHSGYPFGSVAVDHQGNVYVTDYGNDRVQKFDSHGKFISKWGQRGSADGEFAAPYGIAVDKEGRVYVMDDGTGRLQVFDGDGRFIRKFGGRGTGDGLFQNPSYFTLDSQGNVYIPDTELARVQKFSPDGALISKWSTTCGAGGQMVSNAIAIDREGNAYVTDHDHFRVCKFDGQGRFLLAWGSQGTGNGQFSDLSGIVIDELGNIYVAGALPPHVQKFRLP